jgi:hypothetical protein
MIVRKTLSWILALILIAGMTASPVLADGTGPGGGPGSDIHPWDTNDGDSDAGGDNVTVEAAQSAVIFVRTGTRGQFTLMRVYTAPAALRGAVTQKSKSAARTGAALETTKTNR